MEKIRSLGALEKWAGTMDEDGGLVVFNGLPSGDIYSPAWWEAFSEKVCKPLTEKGWNVLLTCCERYDTRGRQASELHLKGDPRFYAAFSLVHVRYPAAERKRMSEASKLIMDKTKPILKTPPTEAPVVDENGYTIITKIISSPMGEKKKKEEQEVPSSSSFSSLKPHVSRVRAQPRRLLAMTVKEKPAKPAKKTPPPAEKKTATRKAKGKTLEVVCEAGSVFVQERVEVLPVVESLPEFVQTLLQPVHDDGSAPLRFVSDGPTGEDYTDMGTPDPDFVPEVDIEPEGENEVIVSGRTTDAILHRVVALLHRKELLAYDQGKLWVQTSDGAWVSDAEGAAHLRVRLTSEITWTESSGWNPHAPRRPHFALLDLADLLIHLPPTHLPRRPTARDGRVMRISEMGPLVGKIVALDTETSGPGENGALNPRLNQIELLQINDGTRVQLLTTRGCTTDEITEGFRKIFDHADVILGHNLMFDLPTIWAKTRLLPKAIFDTMIAAILLKVASEKMYHGGILQGMGLKDTLAKYLNIPMDKELQRSDWAAEWSLEQLEYASKDVHHLHALMERQIELLNQIDSGAKANLIGLKNRVARLEMAMILVMVEPQVLGIPVNRAEVEREIEVAHQKELETMATFLRKYPQVSNLNSRPQVLAALAEDTEDGGALPDLQATTLAAWVHKPGVRMFHDYKVAVQVYRNLKRYREDIVYPGWLVIGGGAGRMATRDPGVQNVPKQIKPKFYSPSLTIVKADYPAIESRLAAVYTGEEGLIKAFNEGRDIHIQTASLVMNKPEGEITKKDRQLAKALNYGLLYGVGATTFQVNANTEYGLSLTIEEAGDFREKFFEAYPSLREWQYGTAKALRSGKGMFTRTLYGRVMRQNQDDYTDALNYPIQGSGADLLKLAAVKVWMDLKKFGGKARILNLVHDEIVVAVFDPAIKQQVALVVRDAMEEAAMKLMPEVKTPVDVQIVDATKDTLFGGME
jgi:DNA polymerase-1